MLWLGCRPVKQEEQDHGELYNFLKQLHTSLITVHRHKQCGMTSRKAFYKKLKEGKAGFLNSKFSGWSLLWTTSVVHDSMVHDAQKST